MVVTQVLEEKKHNENDRDAVENEERPLAAFQPLAQPAHREIARARSNCVANGNSLNISAREVKLTQRLHSPPLTTSPRTAKPIRRDQRSSMRAPSRG